MSNAQKRYNAWLNDPLMDADFRKELESIG